TVQLLRGPHPSSFGTELSHHQQVRPLVLRPRIAPGVLYRENRRLAAGYVAAAPSRKASLVPGAPSQCQLVTYGWDPAPECDRLRRRPRDSTAKAASG